MNKAAEKGNELVIQLDEEAINGPDAKKVEAVFTLIENVRLEMNKVVKRP